MRGITTGRTEPVRAPPDPLQIGVEGQAEPGAELGQGRSVGSGEASLLLCDRWIGLVEHTVGGRDEMVDETAAV